MDNQFEPFATVAPGGKIEIVYGETLRNTSGRSQICDIGIKDGTLFVKTKPQEQKMPDRISDELDGFLNSFCKKGGAHS